MTTNETNSGGYAYRFRNVKNLLGRKELENSEIYFAAPEQLNDPLEGHINVYWQGDEVIWRNLFRHYLNCVLLALGLFADAEQKQETAEWKFLHIRNPLINGVRPEHIQLRKQIFEHEVIANYIERIAQTPRRIGPYELNAHLEAIHPFVIYACYMWYSDRANAEVRAKVPDFSKVVQRAIDRARRSMQLTDQLDAACGNDAEKREEQYKLLMLAAEESSVLNYYKNTLDVKDKNRAFVHNDFCRAYVLNLRTLMYPRWFAACFMERCSGEAMWAYYGDSHAGVCLKYKTVPDSAKKPSLRINMPVGLAGGVIFSYLNLQFLPVTYEAAHLEQNFFDTLHAVTIPVLNQQWMYDDQGRRSKCGRQSAVEESDWRTAYWQDARYSTSIKTRAWQAEGESRLVYQSDGFNLDVDTQLRTMKYDFSALDGIIFGIRTPATDKIKIIEIIERKCKEAGRTDFNFYQAVQTRTGEIECVRLRGISEMVTHRGYFKSTG